MEEYFDTLIFWYLNTSILLSFYTQLGKLMCRHIYATMP